MSNRYQSYKLLYKQDFSIPIPYLDDFNINFGKVLTFIFLFIINSIILGLLTLGGTKFLFVPRPIVSFILTSLQMAFLMKVPTAGKPLILWVVYVCYFLLFVPKATRAFRKIKLIKRWRETWMASFRPVIATSGREVEYAVMPVMGEVKKFEGLTFQTQGATRFVFNPLTKKVNIQVGTFEKLQPVQRSIGRFRSTVIDVGRGTVRVLQRKGTPQVEYHPDWEGEE